MQKFVCTLSALGLKTGHDAMTGQLGSITVVQIS